MILAVTNRKICKGDFLERIEEIAKARPRGIILREKDLEPESYEELALACKQVCDKYDAPLVVHTHIEAAKNIGADCLQLPMDVFLKHHEELKSFMRIGVSVHSVEEGKLAETMGADYLIAGHIFPTDCKKGLPPRGLDFLKKLCGQVSIPVFAIGGISKDNVSGIKDCGAAGVCNMSELMTCGDPFGLVQNFHRLLK